MNDNDNFIFNVKTVQSGAFRILVESLKEILTDINIIFDQSGIKLIATDNSQIVLIHMKLLCENFEEYYCEKKTNIGLNMNNLFKLIKIMGNNDILNLYIEKNDMNRLGIRIYNENKNTQTTFKLNLLDISEEEINIPPAEFETELSFAAILIFFSLVSNALGTISPACLTISSFLDALMASLLTLPSCLDFKLTINKES